MPLKRTSVRTARERARDLLDVRESCVSFLSSTGRFGRAAFKSQGNGLQRIADRLAITLGKAVT